MPMPGLFKKRGRQKKDAPLTPAPAPDTTPQQTPSPEVAAPTPVAVAEPIDPRMVKPQYDFGPDVEDEQYTPLETERIRQEFMTRREQEKKVPQHYNTFFSPPGGLLPMSRIPDGMMIPLLGALVMKESVNAKGQINVLDTLIHYILELSLARGGKARDAFQKLVTNTARAQEPVDMGTEQ